MVGWSNLSCDFLIHKVSESSSIEAGYKKREQPPLQYSVRVPRLVNFGSGSRPRGEGARLP